MIPSTEQIEKLKGNALKNALEVSLIVIIDGDEIARYDLSN